MKQIYKNTKGFTLVEILIVITLLVFIGSIAIGSYINANNKYQFISYYKESLSILRTARLYAITNREIDNIDFKDYGVFINRYCIILFADSGNNILKFDPSSNENLGENCLNNNEEINSELNEDSVRISLNEYFFTDYNFTNFIKVNITSPQNTNIDLNESDNDNLDLEDTNNSTVLSSVNTELDAADNDYIIQTKKFLFDNQDYYFDIDNITLPITIFYELSSGKVKVINNNNELDIKSLIIDFLSIEDDLKKSILFFKYSGLSEEN